MANMWDALTMFALQLHLKQSLNNSWTTRLINFVFFISGFEISLFQESNTPLCKDYSILNLEDKPQVIWTDKSNHSKPRKKGHVDFKEVLFLSWVQKSVAMSLQTEDKTTPQQKRKDNTEQRTNSF